MILRRLALILRAYRWARSHEIPRPLSWALRSHERFDRGRQGNPFTRERPL